MTLAALLTAVACIGLVLCPWAWLTGEAPHEGAHRARPGQPAGVVEHDPIDVADAFAHDRPTVPLSAAEHADWTAITTELERMP